MVIIYNQNWSKDQFKNWLYKNDIFNESKAFSQRNFDDKYHLQQTVQNFEILI